MTIKVGEVGQPCRIAANFDLSGSTSLTINWEAPTGGTDFIVTNPDVTAPAVALANDRYLGNQSASTYFEYSTTGLEFDIDGDWIGVGTYIDGTRELYTNPVTFPIDKNHL